MRPPVVVADFDRGEEIRVVEGPFASMMGKVEEVNVTRAKLRVLVSIFGRPTSVELDFTQLSASAEAALLGAKIMAKKIINQVKLQILAGKANPSPPIGPALGAAGVNIPMFCKEFNARTQKQAGEGLIIPTVITVYADRTFSFELKTPPAAILLKKAARIDKGSGEPNKEKVATLRWAQVEEIAKAKMPDLNTKNIESAKRTIAGTARSMGIIVQ